MTTATVMSFVGVVLSSLLFLIAAVAVAMMGRGRGRALVVVGLLLGLLHNLSNVFLFPMLGHGAADSGFWLRYMTYSVVRAVWSFVTWGLIAAGIILMSRRVLRRPYAGTPYAPTYATNDPGRQTYYSESLLRPHEGMVGPELHSTRESIANRLGSVPDDSVPYPPRHPSEGSGATSARHPGQ